MALEWTILTELEPAVGFTVADGAGIEKGALLELNAAMTVTTNNGNIDKIIGIAAEEKVANDGKTELGVYLRGIFKCTAGASITFGDGLMNNAGSGAVNEVIPATAPADMTHVFAIALETVNDQATLKVLLNVGIGGSVES